MIESPPALPAASLHNASLWRRLLARLAEPPRWARQANSWSSSAALATGIFLAATMFSMSWGCKCGPERHSPDWQLLDYTRLADLAGIDFGTLVIAVLLIVFLALAAFVPFRLTAAFYRLALARFGRRGAMIWCTALHTALHLGVFVFFNILRPETLIAPLAIGMLWGAWLPHLQLGRNHPNRPFEATE